MRRHRETTDDRNEPRGVPDEHEQGMARLGALYEQLSDTEPDEAGEWLLRLEA